MEVKQTTLSIDEDVHTDAKSYVKKSGYRGGLSALVNTLLKQFIEVNRTLIDNDLKEGK